MRRQPRSRTRTPGRSLDGRARTRATQDPLDIDPRLMRRQRRLGRARRNTRRRRVPLVLWLLAILVVEIVVVGLRDPRFRLARVDVRGSKVLTTQQVVRLSGLQLGTNLFRLSLKGSRRRLLAAPAVAGVSLHRRVPNRVVIRVRERQPMACVASANGLFTIDAEGVVFRADAAAPKGLPLVAGMEAEKLRLGARIEAEQARALKECLAAAAAGKEHPLTRISIDQNGNLCFNSSQLGYQVRLGPPEQLPEKFALLAALERSLPDIRENCEYIDVSCLDAPAWKPGKVAVASGGRMPAP